MHKLKCMVWLKNISFYYVKLNPECHGKSSVQEEDTFRQQTGFKFKEETSEMLNLEHSSL